MKKLLAFAGMSLCFSVAHAQLQGLPEFDTYYPVVPFALEINGPNTQEVLVHTFDGMTLPSLVYVESLDSGIYVTHQNSPFAWSESLSATAPMHDYRRFDVWQVADSAEDEWYFLAIDPNDSLDYSALVKKTGLLSSESSDIVLESDIEFADFVLADVNQDGEPEIVTIRYGDNQPLLLWQNIDGAFEVADTIGYSSYSGHLETSDFNGDGVVDVVAQGQPARVFISQVDGSWDMTYSAPGLGDIEIADFNGDGNLDVASLDYYGQTWTLAYNDGGGVFDGASSIPFPEDGPIYGHSLNATDLNQDGALDLLFTRAVSDSIFVWRNGVDEMDAWVPVEAAGRIGERFISVVDLDLDGDVDWVGAGAYLHLGVHQNHVNPGCTDISACNYDENALTDDGTCVYAEPFLDCDGNCLNDSDGDGVCDELELDGCTENTACNYNPDATEEDDSCEFVGDPCDDGDDQTSGDVLNADCICEGSSTDAVQEQVLGIELFPVPATDVLRVNILNGSAMEVFIYNLAGEVVQSQKSGAPFLLDVSVLSEGFYLVSARAFDQEVITQKLVVKH